MLDIGTDGPHNCPVPFFYPVILLKEGSPCHIWSSSPTTNLSAFIPLVSLCITHPSLAPSTRVFLQRTRSTSPILCLSHSFYIILHFIIFFNFPVDYLVRCGAISCILYPESPSRESFLCDFTLHFTCTLSAHSFLSLSQQSLYHIELCPQLHLPSRRAQGCFH